MFKNDPNSIVIRTSWLYSSFGKNFVKTMIDLMKKNNSVKVVNDQIGSPTYAYDLAKVIIEIIMNIKLNRDYFIIQMRVKYLGLNLQDQLESFTS